MLRLRLSVFYIFFFSLLTACVTINVYFPAAAAEKAADKLINEVWKGLAEQEKATSPDAPQIEPQVEEDNNALLKSTTWLLAQALNQLIPAAHAASAPDFNVSSPAISALKAKMAARFPDLEPHLNSGSIGLSHDGLINIRDLNAIELRSRNLTKKAVEAENNDRNALYQEIANANGHPEWTQKIRDIFSRRWIGNAKEGWYYQNKQGQWLRK